ncbi:MAG TPA: prephenate dehydratase [Vicinamibacteria bacterium]|jgi:prephenate dehydratase|nr:prephenate dehydratase [Vicinamibacteria bacterium]
MKGTRLIVAIQGERGAFSHEAARRHLGEAIELLPRSTFDALFAAVASGEADRAVVPIENSLVGSIHENYDRLRALPLHIVGETQVHVRHCLIARPGATLASIRRVASHPVALAQCTRFFAERPQLEPVTAYDTAGSVMDLLRRDGPVTQAAIASKLAAQLHGGTVLLEGIQDDTENYTRFVILSREEGPLEAASKTSIVFTLADAPGALYRALAPFALRHVDLVKIESRPLRGQRWQYVFYIDVLGDPRGPAGEAVAELRQLAQEFRVLGHYPDGIRGNGDGSGAEKAS